MAPRILLLALTLPPLAASGQTAECLKLGSRLQAFDSKYSLHRFGGPKATLATVEQEFGTAAIEPGTELGTSEAVYALPGCIGHMLINAEGVAWMAKFAVAPLPEPPKLDSLDQLQELEDRIARQNALLEKLQSTRSDLIRQASTLAPTAPVAAGECGHILEVAADTAEDYLLRAWCHHTAGRLEEAIRDYGESLRLAPVPLALHNRALAYFAQGQTALALADMAQIQALAKSSDSRSAEESSTESKRDGIKVKGYTRRDGTYVAPYTRTAPVRK